MQKRLFLLAILAGTILIASAQEAKQERPAKKGCSCSFSSINHAGILNGSKGVYFLAQTINGFRYKTWFAGIGAGYDNYYRSGFQLFLDVRKFILKKSQTPFVYADVGVHVVSDKTDHLNQWYENRFKNGAYAEGGIGYKFGFNGKDRWVISGGYSYKYVKYDNVYIGTCPTSRCYENYFTYRNYLNRFAMKLGFQF
jgi:hypothetical protein